MKLMVTGHRPDKLGGYDDMNPVRVAIKAALREKLLEYKPEVAITGMAQGIDQDFGWVCVELGVPFIAAVPFEGQDSYWPDTSKVHYTRLLGLAREVVHVSPPGYSKEKMFVRNEWMVDHVGDEGIVLAVWDGSSGGTGSCVAYAKRRKRKIVRIDPDAVVSGL